jgi:hypothetical protein
MHMKAAVAALALGTLSGTFSPPPRLWIGAFPEPGQSRYGVPTPDVKEGMRCATYQEHQV